ncbi:MAG: Uma2 family endonuclease [Thermodesulfobacteriota bacterium]|nr:Uma2 family endonuclease [Thermodesulfobacteriota bacterium]
MEIPIQSSYPKKRVECFVGIAPTDVVFSEHDVVQPDVFVVCDQKKITEANIQSSPDLIMEVLSPATSLKDKREKKNLYEKYGVKEYNKRSRFNVHGSRLKSPNSLLIKG